MSHTPGPWEADQDGTDVMAGAIWLADLIGSDIPLNDLSCDERCANARLIAAAPEMLRILREIYAGKSWSTQEMRHAADRNDDSARALIQQIVEGA